STHSDSSSSSWKFWRRRLSTRSRHDSNTKYLGAKDRPEITLLEKSDLSETSDGSITPVTPIPLSGPLPDVVEKTPGIPRFSSNAVPPPKPPRLFLFRTPSNGTRCSTDDEKDTDPVYINSERLVELKSHRHHPTLNCSRPDGNAIFSDCLKNVTNLDIGQSKNLVEQISMNNLMIKGDNNVRGITFKEPPVVTFQLNSSEMQSDNVKHLPQTNHLNTVARKPKIKTPELNSKRAGRSRRRSHDKGEMTRQKHIMNSVSELLRQRLDPYPLLDQLKRAGILTNMDVQSFLGYHDRKSICESIVDLVGAATPDVLPVFCDVLSSAGNSTEILEVLHVVREIDRIIYDVSFNNNNDNPILDDEKNLNYDIGYLAPDYSLKPLVELERVRASGDKRLSKASCRNSAYSLLEGGDSESCNHGDSGVFPGLIMMSICVTGHSLSGQRAEALASLIRNHNCICELRMGKTQLCGDDISIIAKALEENRTIHSLDVRLNHIGEKGAVAVADLLLKTKSLRLLNLSSTNMDLQSIQNIVCATAANKCLTDLDLSFLDVGDECSECLRDMLRANSNLQKLRLRSNNLTWSGCYVIAEGLSRNLCLNVLDLSRNTVGDEGVQALAKFLPESSVTEVSLENCGITSAGCDALADLLTHCKRLKHLDISTNILLDAGICKLAKALERTSSLQNLGLNMCGITNDGFSILLDVLEKNTSIIHMKLCYNRLGREHSIPSANSDDLRYRLRIVTSSKPKLKILLWGNTFEEP
ncbi:unnamed protein product, partial [Candidula unifasciata]